MVKKHMKTLTVPRSWPVKKKGQKFIVRPKPGKSYETSMPMSLVFKNLLKACKTTKEVKSLLMDKEVLVNGSRRKSTRYQVGLMDVLSIPVSKENYRLLLNSNGKLYLQKIDAKEAGSKVVKIIGKTKLKKGIVQLNLYDGMNVLVKKDDFAVGDSLSVEVPSQKVLEHLKLEKGSQVYLVGGSHTGEAGTVAHVAAGKDTLVQIKNKDNVFETPKKFVFVVGKDRSLIKLD